MDEETGLCKMAAGQSNYFWFNYLEKLILLSTPSFGAEVQSEATAIGGATDSLSVSLLRSSHIPYMFSITQLFDQ